MAQDVFRTAAELIDGDEVTLNYGPDAYTEWNGAAVVVEKSFDENDRVLVLLSVEPSATVRTRPRPRELSGSPFGGDA